MNKRNKSKNGKKSNNKTSSRPVVDVSGTLQRFGIPIPRLPILIGSAVNLRQTGNMYPRIELDIPITPQFFGIVAGGLTSVMALDVTVLCQNWASLAGAFAEYCLLGAVLELRMNNLTSPSGLCIAYVDERSNAAPTIVAASSQDHLELLVSATESPSRHLISWKPSQLFELDMTQTSGAAINSWLKLFCATASTGTAAGTAGQVSVTGAVRVRFQGWI